MAGLGRARAIQAAAALAWVAWTAAAASQAVGPPGVTDSAAAPDTVGALRGTVIGSVDGQPVAYGTVMLLGTPWERFADREGSFLFTDIAPGVYTLRAREIGYVPLDTAVTIVAGQTATVTISLRRVAVLLLPVVVRGGRSCGRLEAGIPDSTANSSLAQILSQVRINAERSRLLADAYPFRAFRVERHLVANGGTSEVQVDTAAYESAARWHYRPGRVTYAVADSIGWRRATYMHVPTFLDLADSGFLAAHCFTFGGRRHEWHGPALLEVDFRPVDALRSPDVSGAVYLDSADYVVRRAVFSLSNAQAVDRALRALTVTTTFDELFPLVPVLDSVVTIREARDESAGEDRTTTQDDYLVRIAFEGQFPGDRPTASAPGRAQGAAAAPR